MRSGHVCAEASQPELDHERIGGGKCKCEDEMYKTIKELYSGQWPGLFCILAKWGSAPRKLEWMGQGRKQWFRQELLIMERRNLGSTEFDNW